MLSLYLFIYLFLCLFIYLFTYLFIYIYIYIFIRLFIYLYIYIFIRIFIRIFIYSYIHLLIYLFVYLFIYLFIYVFSGKASTRFDAYNRRSSIILKQVYTFMYLLYLTFDNIVSCLLSIFLLFFFYLLIYLPVLLSFLLFQYKMMYPSFLFSYTCPLILIFNSLCITSKRIFGRVNKHQHSTHSRCTSTYLLVKKHIWNRTDLGLE